MDAISVAYPINYLEVVDAKAEFPDPTCWLKPVCGRCPRDPINRMHSAGWKVSVNRGKPR